MPDSADRQVRRFLDDLWRWKCGLPEGEREDYDSRLKTEWSTEFEYLMRNRLIVGSYRYGLIGADGKPKYDRLKAIRTRLDDYEKGGNLERLVDVANLCLLEFCETDHPLKHFRSAGVEADEAGDHVQVRGKG